MENSSLFIVLKTSERCNLNCRYCYFFNKGEESYKLHPAFISEKTVFQLVSFLKQGINDLRKKTISISFHGGEPMLQPVKQFDALCSYLKAELSEMVDLHLSIQTNATLISDKWIEVLAKHNVFVGVSLDGPKEYNDIDRIDHKAQGSYEKVRRGIEKLKQAFHNGEIKRDIGALCVINPYRNSRLIYRHFVDELKFTWMDFLLPDFTHDDFDPKTVDLYGKYLCELLDEWISDNDSNIKVRLLESIIRVMGGKKTTFSLIGPEQDNSHVLTVSSNGELSPDDTLRIADRGKLMQIASIWNISMKEFFQLPTIQAISNCRNQLPNKCLNCCWKYICQGGFPIHRYSKINGFDNPSLMCDALKKIYARVAILLLKRGYSFSSLQERLLAH